MAVIKTFDRPAIDIVQDGFTRPDEPWAHLGDPEQRALLQAAIPSVGRIESPASGFEFLGTAFVAGKDLLLTFENPMLTAASGNLFVNFGREVVARSAPWVRVEEVVNLPARVTLLRASLPEKLVPLTLAARRPEGIDGRDLAVIAYPAHDQRNDPDYLSETFGSVYDVKRLLPGRALGVNPEDTELTHDCTTTGGCAGAPVLDVVSGLVLGLHHSGRSLQANYAFASWALATSSELARVGVVFSETPGTVVPTGDRSLAKTLNVIEDELTVTASVDQPEVDTDRRRAEATVQTAGRPAPVVGGRFQPDPSWATGFVTRDRANLDRAVRGVAKLTITGDDGREVIGSAFLVDERHVLTATSILEAFRDGDRAAARIGPGATATVDFSHATGLPAGTATTRVRAIGFLHPFFDMALLVLEEPPRATAVLDLAAKAPAELAGRPVAVVSYTCPGADHGGRSGGLFVQPGEARQIGYLPGSDRVPALIHSCTTADGAAGSPVVDVGTGLILGVHTATEAPGVGLAQPSWELARDPFVWEHQVRFQPDPRPSWLDRWNTPGGHGAAPATPTRPDPGRWTVDELPPMTWDRPGLLELERSLGSISHVDGLMLAMNAGLDTSRVDTSGSAWHVWRRIITSAAVAAKLRLMIEQIADDPQYAGLADDLRRFL
jgi:Trypsin-like peptidase domain